MFKVLTEGCEPKRATKFSAAVDLYANADVVIKAGETCKVPLGVCIDIDDNMTRKMEVGIGIYGLETFEERVDTFKTSHYLQLEPRSSLRAKGLIAGTGIIDLDYKDEICLILHNPYIVIDTPRNTSDDSFKISKGEKIAQIMLCEHKSYLMGYESEEERKGGFGSSGK